MKALVYHGPGSKAWEEVPEPTIIDDTDAIVCGRHHHLRIRPPHPQR